VRNRAAIVAATSRTLRANPDASVADIAQAAGVGRVTLYGHFATRADLLDAALVDVLDGSNRVLEELDLDGDPREALGRLVASSWTLLDEVRALVVAAQRELPPGRVRELHDGLEDRVRRLLGRGQREGAFRDDLPVGWLLATMHALMNGAANEVASGRLDPAEAGPLLQATLLAAYAPQVTS
jgi:AcrR family transcriptional regulator